LSKLGLGVLGRASGINGGVMYKTQLKTSQLGATGMEITRVGFGAWAIGGAVAWTLRNPAVDGAITGFRRPGQVDPIVAGAGLELTDEDINEIEATR
jgi:aryl-alcohol dehydrogenase-like predicted oxidoreductase